MSAEHPFCTNPRSPAPSLAQGLRSPPKKGQIHSPKLPASTAPPAKTLAWKPAAPGTSKGGAKRALCAAAGAQAGGFAGAGGMFALLADLSGPPPALPLAARCRQQGWMVAPARCGGFPCRKAPGVLCHPREGMPTAGQQSRSSQCLLDHHSLTTLGQEEPRREKAPRRGFTH